MRARSALPLLTALLCLGAFAQTDPPKGAKEAFFDEENKSAAQAGEERRAVPHDESGRRVVRPRTEGERPRGAIGLSYWIELLPPGQTIGTQVTDARVFHSGERIRLHFRSNSRGHIEVVALEPSGTATRLFPDVTKGLGDNAVRADGDRIIPGEHHWMLFDQHSGTERIMVLFARTQDELERTFATKRIMTAEETARLLQYQDRLRGGKGMLIEAETERADELGVYGVSVTGQPLMLEIDLHHQ